jgi:ammonia channel protein AmtB
MVIPQSRRVRAIAWIIFVLSLLAILFCGYAFLFWAWVTATPLTPAQLARAQYNAYLWAGLAGASLVAAVIALFGAIRLGRRRLHSGFDVVPSSGGPAAG